jgi:hypothetical protein
MRPGMPTLIVALPPLGTASSQPLKYNGERSKDHLRCHLQ